jgi:predicted transcriptional regulator
MAEDPPTFGDLMLAENPQFADVMRCVFAIRRRETETYLELLDAGEVRADDLADRLDRDRSNASRSLSRLREKGLVERRRELLDGGGHVYCYRATPLAEVRRRLHEGLDQWAEEVHERIETFGRP